MMRSSRVLSRVLTTAGAAALGALALAPTMAAAAAADTVTVAGGSSYTYTFNQSPSIQATAQPNCQFLGNPGQISLTVSGPGVTNSTLVTHNGSCSKAVTLSPSATSVNTAHPTWNGGSTPADNGTYTVTLNNQGRTKSASFILLIPPARPTGFTATPDGGTTVAFQWSPNPESDITGYEIVDPAGDVVTSPSNPCSAGTCLAGPVDVGTAEAGKTERFSLYAIRSCGDASCSGGAIASTSAATADATFPAPPTPTPSPTKSKPSGGNGGGTSGNGGGAGNGGGGSTTHLGNLGGGTGGSATHGGGAITLHGDGSSVNLGSTNGGGDVNNALPPASSGDGALTVQAPPLPGVQTSTETLGAGGKPGKIKYPAPLLAHKSQSESLVHDIGKGLSLPPLWKGIAAAAVLVLIAVHLRAWVSRAETGYDEGGSRPRPMRTF